MKNHIEIRSALLRKTEILTCFLIILIVTLTGCTDHQSGRLTVPSENTYLYFENEKIILRFDEQLFCKVSYREDDRLLSINDDSHDGTSGLPSHFIEANGVTYSHFRQTSHKVEEVDDVHLGKGKRLILTGELPGITKTLSVEMYESLPDVAISKCTYTNLTNTEMHINRIGYDYYRLDRRLTNSGENSNSFRYLQPLNKRWGETWTNLALTDTTDENFLVPGSGSNYSGIPFIDVWGTELGMSVFHVEGIPRFLNLKLQVQEDKKVDIGLITVPENSYGQFPDNIAPGDSVTTWKSAVCVHKGDFFNPARRFGQLLDIAIQQEGRKGFIKEYPEQAYEPYWKTWGMNSLSGSGDFTAEQVLAKMDELAGYGFKAVMLDDGWQDYLGTWNPNPDKFKNEQELIDFVKEAHTPKWGRNKNQSFKVYLWFDLLGADTITEVIEPLLVKNADGSYYESKQSKYTLCPSYSGTHSYIRDSLVQKIIGRWNIDGLYTDWEDQNPLPCFAENHHHNPHAESVENNYQAFEQMFDAIIELKPDNGWVSQCACAAVHDVYQYPYYHVEDASDPTTNEQVRWRFRFMKALRGGKAPLGDGYVDKMNYNKLAGEPAQSVAAGSVITSLRWEVDELGGEEHARKWMELYFSEGISSGDYLGLYDIAYDSPEGHVVRKDDGTLYYSFFDDAPFEKEVELRGMDPQKKYRMIQYEEDTEMGTVSGNDAMIKIRSKQGNSQGEPVFYQVIKCVPDFNEKK